MLNMEDYLAALYVFGGIFISYDTSETYGEDSDPSTVHLTSQAQSPEQVMIIQDLFCNLQKDSRWLLSLIQDHPETVATPKTKKVTKESIIRYLKKNKRWSKIKICNTIREIEGFLIEMESV